MIKKRHEQCVVLLDDCFDSASIHRELSEHGFQVERFTDHFPDEHRDGYRAQNIKDGAVIQLCQRRGFLLFTADREMRRAHLEKLKKTDIGVVATANYRDGTAVWIAAFASAKARILRDFKKAERPYFSILQKSGRITTEHIGANTRASRAQDEED